MLMCNYNKNISANALLFDSEGFMNNVGGMVMIIYNELKMKTNYNCTLVGKTRLRYLMAPCDGRVSVLDTGDR